MSASYPILPGEPSPAAQSYAIRSGYPRPQAVADTGGFWATTGQYAVFGVLAASALQTLIRARRPMDIVDGILLAVNASLESEQAIEDTRFNMELFAFFAPVVAAAGVAFAIQLARLMSRMEK